MDMAKFVGKHVIVRSDQSGVHFGVLAGVEAHGDLLSTHLSDARRLWSWTVAGKRGISVTDIAVHGIDQDSSRINAQVPDIIVAGVCEIVPAYGGALLTIPNAPVATGA